MDTECVASERQNKRIFMLTMKEQRRQERVAKRLAAVGFLKKGKEAGVSGKVKKESKKEYMRELARQRRAAAEAEKAGGQSYTTSTSRWGKETKVSVTDTKKIETPPPEEASKKSLVDLMID